jgi:hypothetical protein
MADYQEGQTATNPKTGQKVVFRNGQWVNAGGAAGGPQIGGMREQMRYNALQDQAGIARSRIRDLLTARTLVNQQPTGFIPGAVQGLKRMLGSDTMPTQAREQLDALNNRMVMNFRQPGGDRQISDAERASFRQSLANPAYQRGSNQGIIGRDMAGEWSNLADSKLAAKWRASVGSLDAKSPSGMTFDQALSRMHMSPSFRAGLERARTITPGDQQHGAVIDFHELPE